MRGVSSAVAGSLSTVFVDRSIERAVLTERCLWQAGIEPQRRLGKSNVTPFVCIDDQPI